MNFSTITVPPGRVLRKIQKEGQPPKHGLRRMASTSTPPKRDVFELGPRSESRNSLNFDRRQPQQQQSRRPYTGRSNFVWPFHKSGSLETTTTTTTRRRLPLNERSSNNSSTSTTARAPKIRVVGRGGSGSKLRQVSLSNPAVVVLESESTSCLRQPHDQDSLFYRPTGRGGLGSRRSTGTSPPSAMKPLKPPTAILDLIRGRKRSDAQLNERFKIHNKSSPPRRSQSLYYRPQKDSFTRIVTRTGSNSLDDPSGSSILEIERHSGTSISHNIHHPDDDNNDTDSYLEEEIYRTANEHRERSLNKLTRTLGAHPSSLLEGSSKSPIFDNFSPTTRGGGDTSRFIGGQRSYHTRWDSLSFESEESDDDDTHSDHPHSPITFAPISGVDVENTTYHHHHHHHHHHSEQQQTHTRLASTSTSSDVDSSYTTTSSTRGLGEDNSAHQSHSHHHSHSHFSSPNKSTTSSTAMMPRLHISTHSDAVSVPNDHDSDVVPDLMNGPVAKRPGWLVPLDEVVISIRRTAPSKPQSWTGEWNREMRDVIRDLRRL